MSQTLQQIYIANPSTSMAGTDLLYKVPSPYSSGSDQAILWSNVLASAGGTQWSNISGTTQTAAVNSGYIIGNASQTTITLPVTAAVGSTVKIAGKGAGGWVLAPGAGQTIHAPVGTASASITSAEADDAIEVVCVTANTTWLVLSSSSTGLVIV